MEAVDRLEATEQQQDVGINEIIGCEIYGLLAS